LIGEGDIPPFAFFQNSPTVYVTNTVSCVCNIDGGF
jgi:hypothetical protein